MLRNKSTLNNNSQTKIAAEMESLPNGQSNTNPNGIIEKDIDLEFLPLIYEIIKSIERDPTHDSTQKPRDSQDTSAKILELEKKLNQAREQINQLPGIEHSQEEQLKQVENLRKQLSLKRQLLSKGVLGNERMISKLSESGPIRRAAQLYVYFYNKHKHSALEYKHLAQLKGSKLADKLKQVYEDLEQQSKKLK